jgi:heme-degrading monooxygenase HmoA
MYARINQFQAQTDPAGRAGREERTRNFENNIVSVMKKQKGFKHLYGMGDPQTGKTVLVTIWDSEADLQAWLSSTDMAEAVAKYRAANPDVPAEIPFEDYEVFTHA